MWNDTVARLLKPLPWIVLLALALVTLGPRGLRPDIGLPLDIERFLGFAAVAMAFSFAYPKHKVRVALAVIMAAAALEAMQQFLPHRHGSVHDFIVKAEGTGCGVLAAALFHRALSKSLAVWKG